MRNWLPGFGLGRRFLYPTRLTLKLGVVAPIVGSMKRIAVLIFGLALSATPAVPAQDAATEERLNKLAGQIDDMRANQEALTRKIELLAKELDGVRGKLDKPSGSYASDEDLKRLADAVKEIDRKRLDDYEKIRVELKNLGKSLSAPAPRAKPPSTISESPSVEKSGTPDKGFEYQVKKGDTLNSIVQAYHDNNIKVTMDQILKANPGLKPEKMRVGQKIFIPAPAS
jgi:LysM repeat protein